MEKLFKSIIEDAIKSNVSDIHFIPVIDDKIVVQMRFNGDNKDYDLSLDAKLYNRLLIYMKFISHLDVSERNKAQSGQYIYEHVMNYYLRISTIPISLGIESCAIRITPQYFIESNANRLNSDFIEIRNKMYQSEGLFLFTGPTESGKTTLMYELMYDLKKEKNKHIITIEDPVEQFLLKNRKLNQLRKKELKKLMDIKRISGASCIKQKKVLSYVKQRKVSSLDTLDQVYTIQ
ncbi:ATPase, T2SS/T4P/T4SS family [Mammaliicoccus vitulinus]|uniref:ATPase, T2SS/T4P/T4SS family n=1 Tax=Mammaliicoccus vitulinus TaxID=71237 RepID=UPI001F5446BC|nr:ATPase, T2SS/T4P/T4SS family [Mammaliicoccus vitulinus]